MKSSARGVNALFLCTMMRDGQPIWNQVKGEIVQCFLVLVIRCSRKSNKVNWNLDNLYASIVLKKFLRIHWHLGDFTFVSAIPHEHPLLCSLKLFFNCDKHLSCLTWRTIRNVLPLVSGLAFLKLNLNPISFICIQVRGKGLRVLVSVRGISMSSEMAQYCWKIFCCNHESGSRYDLLSFTWILLMEAARHRPQKALHVAELSCLQADENILR